MTTPPLFTSISTPGGGTTPPPPPFTSISAAGGPLLHLHLDFNARRRDDPSSTFVPSDFDARREDPSFTSVHLNCSPQFNASRGEDPSSTFVPTRFRLQEGGPLLLLCSSHAKHEKTSSLVSFVFGVFPLHAEYEKTPSSVSFRTRRLPFPDNHARF